MHSKWKGLYTRTQCTTRLPLTKHSYTVGIYHQGPAQVLKTVTLLYGVTIPMCLKATCKYLLGREVSDIHSLTGITFSFDGLFGAILIYRPGVLDAHAKPKHVDHEFVTTINGNHCYLMSFALVQTATNT